MHCITVISHLEKIRITKSDSYKFEIGSTARLECQVRGMQPWTITWSKVGSSTKHLPPHITKEGVLLIIKKSKLGDSGNYSCKVANSFSSSSTTMVLNIYSKYLQYSMQNSSVGV